MYKPTWMWGIVVSIINGFNETHTITFKAPGIIENFPKGQYPMAKRLGEPLIDVDVGDEVMIYNFNPDAGNMFYYTPFKLDNKVQLMSGVTRKETESKDEKGRKTLEVAHEAVNKIDLTSTYNVASKTPKRNDLGISISSKNRILLETGTTSIFMDGENGVITIEATSNSPKGTDIQINGNVSINGTLTATGDVNASGGGISLNTHMHYSPIAIPDTPPQSLTMISAATTGKPV